ncbi:hypothetical protein CASFOL_007235 [Castilleja foliolosa]|uniref:RNase H type-1 domain-containing protein n=1 Tax=Castilleja foliolosa TaxID=1961234 RepID=A0ABD3E971_9LAMI
MSINGWLSLLFLDNSFNFPSCSMKAEFINFTVVLLDHVWFTRNKIAHGSHIPSIKNMIAHVSRIANSHWVSLAKNGQISNSPSRPWIAPPPGWITVNVDAAFADGLAYSGVVFRDSNGSVFFSAAYRHHCLDATTAESLAIADACNELVKKKLKLVCVESDCVLAISFLNVQSSNCYWTASPVIEKIRYIWKDCLLGVSSLFLEVLIMLLILLPTGLLVVILMELFL